MNKKICPKCKSTNVSYKPEAFEVSSGATFQKYKCNNCGYDGMMPNLEENKNEKQK